MLASVRQMVVLPRSRRSAYQSDSPQSLGREATFKVSGRISSPKTTLFQGAFLATTPARMYDVAPRWLGIPGSTTTKLTKTQYRGGKVLSLPQQGPKPRLILRSAAYGHNQFRDSAGRARSALSFQRSALVLFL